jgi:hypothetical protein
MVTKLVSCFVAGALGATVAVASPAWARGGGGGGMHGGGMGGAMHAGGMAGGMHFGAMGGGMRFGGSSFAGAHFVHAGFSPRFSRFGFRDHRFFRHNRFNRFAFVGAPFLYAAYYDGCWRTAWTPYGPQWINACGYY